MKKKFRDTALVDEYLDAVTDMKAIETAPFFYSRLISKLQESSDQQEWRFPLKPVWMVLSLSALLIINGVILSQQFSGRPENTETASPMQSFATAYDLSIQSTY